jgi:hypothetical protein
VRVRWEIAGGNAAFSVEGVAHVLYCTPADLLAVTPKATLAKATDEDRLLACIAASGIAEGETAAAYTMPLTAWPLEYRHEAARIAVGKLVSGKVGQDPMKGPDESITNDVKNALHYFARIAAGKTKPPGLLDTTPTVFEASHYVARGTSRGW